MTGFKIKIGEREITAALPSGASGVIFTYAHGKGTIDLSGCTADNWSYRWLKEDLQPEENILISFTEVEEVSPPTEVHDVFRCSKEEQIQIRNQNDLKTYHQLRQELLDEGLIGPED